MRIVAAHAIRESLRRRVFLVVLVLSIVFLGLYAWGTNELFEDVSGFDSNSFGVDATTLAGATVLGLAMFAILFLGAVLATFLSLGAVRGDADTGLLQPLIVRPLGRTSYLGGRLLAAAAVSAAYVVVLFGACTVITGVIGWWPDRFLAPALGLAGGAVVIAATTAAPPARPSAGPTKRSGHQPISPVRITHAPKSTTVYAALTVAAASSRPPR